MMIGQLGISLRLDTTQFVIGLEEVHMQIKEYVAADGEGEEWKTGAAAQWVPNAVEEEPSFDEGDMKTSDIQQGCTYRSHFGGWDYFVQHVTREEVFYRVETGPKAGAMGQVSRVDFTARVRAQVPNHPPMVERHALSGEES